MNLSPTVIVENAMILYIKMLLKLANVVIITPTPHWVLRYNQYDDVIFRI